MRHVEVDHHSIFSPMICIIKLIFDSPRELRRLPVKCTACNVASSDAPPGGLHPGEAIHLPDLVFIREIFFFG